MRKLLIILIAVLLSSCMHHKEKPLTADSGYAGLPLEHCSTDLKHLNQVLGWQTSWPSQWQAIILAGPEELKESLKNWDSAPKAINSSIEKLRLGIRMNETAPRPVVLHVLQQVSDLSMLLADENSEYIFKDNVNGDALIWNNLVIENIAPAIADFKIFLRDEYLPKARVQPGLYLTKDGSQCFLNSVSWWTSLELSLDQIDKIGWQYINETRLELLETGTEGETLEDILNRLRVSSDNNQTTVDELINISTSALSRAQKNTHLTFKQRSPQDIVVTMLPQHMHAAFPAGRYAGPLNDATAARYIINPSRPNERRLMAEVISFHEGIPGHHLWATYPRDIPATKFSSGHSGITEGWAIYSEYLADEMGLFSSTFDRQGMLAKHLWAASRLIVEPGLHIHGWSREQAINFMLENTVMSRVEIELEVDRYIAMPGQSLSYILGADLILNERKRARNIMGTDFDIKEFHDVVLGAGTRPLPLVRQDIRAWVDSFDTEKVVDTNISIKKVWTMINDSFGGEHFNLDQWAKINKEFLPHNYHTSDEEHTAIKTILSQLEEPSVRFLTKEEKEAFLNEISGLLPAGIGLIELLSIDIDDRTKILTVITCVPGTPAAKAGLQSGDQIIKINGVHTKKLSLSQAMDKLRVASGTNVTLDVMRNNTPLTFLISSEGARKTPSPVRSFTQNHNDNLIGYIQYLIVANGSAADFREALSSLILKGVDAIVLDMRNNPGGTVDDALTVADLFLKKDSLIASLKAGKDKMIKEYYAIDNPLWEGPTVILQNEGSASAAELIAGALQANNKAIIVGQKSYGKGLMHTLIPLADGATVMFHVGRLISPHNRDILHEMIIPDHIIIQTPSPIMSKHQEEVGTITDLQYQYAVSQILKRRGK